VNDPSYLESESISLRYVEGDATSPVGDGRKIIVHVCNDIGAWGAGFVMALSRKWPQPEELYRKTYPYNLGDVAYVLVEHDIMVANLIGQTGLSISQSRGIPVRYWAIEKGMWKVKAKAEKANASIHMPRMGCGLAGGSWDEVFHVLSRVFEESNVPITVYDF